jgi:hypothetical protein
MLEREGKTPAAIKKLKQSIPPSRKIIKTDLAKYECAWSQRPDLVSLGGQKAFQAFMTLLTQKGGGEIILPSIPEFKHIIARVILFKSIYKTIRKEYPSYQANITAYTVAITSKLLSERLSLDVIWTNQGISSELHDQMYLWSQEVSHGLHSSSRGKMISEWAKKQECWVHLSNQSFSELKYEIRELR